MTSTMVGGGGRREKPLHFWLGGLPSHAVCNIFVVVVVLQFVKCTHELCNEITFINGVYVLHLLGDMF